MKKLPQLLSAIMLLLISCVGGDNASSNENTTPPKSMLADSQDPMENKGIGPITSVELPGEIDYEMAREGEEVYIRMCTACHKPDKKFIGSAPKGIFECRSPEWIMNMILNPEVMIMKDPIAKQLLIEFNGAPMSYQNLTKEQVRQVLEYFRTL